MKNLQFDTFLCKIHGIVAEIYANTPDIALARFIFPTPFVLKRLRKGNKEFALKWWEKELKDYVSKMFLFQYSMSN